MYKSSPSSPTAFLLPALYELPSKCRKVQRPRYTAFLTSANQSLPPSRGYFDGMLENCIPLLMLFSPCSLHFWWPSLVLCCNWRTIKKEKRVLDVMHSGYTIEFPSTHPHKPLSHPFFRDYSYEESLHQEMDSLLQQGAIGCHLNIKGKSSTPNSS